MMHVNRSRARQARTDDGTDEAGRQHAMGDTGLEEGPLGIGFIDVGRVQVAGDAGEKIDIGIGHGFGKPSLIADVQFVECFSYHFLSFTVFADR
ncbi:hypothetical protein DESC_720112 [Desulfosarcina cetonica]|nr:hypothetical protein DESC_720112 [Desulfosarcina cetonica]